MWFPLISCRFGDGEAIAVWDMPGGCLCHPEDRVQALCLHHSHRATPLDGMKLLFDLTVNQRVTEIVQHGAVVKGKDFWRGSWSLHGVAVF